MRQISMGQSGSPTNSVVLSPVNVYEVSINQGSFQSCDNEDQKCSVSLQLNWLARNEGRFSIICPVLDGNSCGDHGLALNEDNICHQGEIHNGILGKDQSLTLSLWYVPHALFSINCFLWATADGTLPATIGTSEANEELAEALVRCLH